MARNRKVLVTVLNWGLGHATRCIPIINELQSHNFDVFIASDGASLLLLKGEFPNCAFFELPSYKIRYGDNLILSLAKGSAAIVRAVLEEKRKVEQIVTYNDIDIIISDNRYGCYSANTQNIFLCHQHTLIVPAYLKMASGVINFFHRQMMANFDSHWIPDVPNSELSGLLSYTPFENVNFIGVLSRMKYEKMGQRYSVAALVSGAEFQRTNLENIIENELHSYNKSSVLICGRIEERKQVNYFGELTKVNFMLSDELNNVLNMSEIVISRSGYSTIMDLKKLGRKAVFIPTPGQTEQEYLAKYFEQLGIAPYFSQHNFSLSRALDAVENYKGFSIDTESNLLLKAIMKL